MPYPLDVFSPENTAQSILGVDEVTLTIGDDWQPGDMRVAVVGVYWVSSGDRTYTFNSLPDWSKRFDQLYTETDGTSEFEYRTGVFTRVLTGSPSDSTLTFAYTTSTFNRIWAYVHLFTVRNPYPGQNWGVSVARSADWMNPGVANLPAPSLATGSIGGTLVTSYVASRGSGQPLDVPSTPPGMTAFASKNSSGSNFDAAMLLARQSFAGGTNTGIKTATAAANAWYTATSIFLHTAPDVTATLGMATETDTALTVGYTHLNTTTLEIGTATPEIDSAAPINTPLLGRRVSQPLAIPEGRVVSSVVQWKQTAPLGTTVTVETSIDGGLTWQEATNRRPVPHLLLGSTDVRVVLTRVTLERPSLDQPSPRMSELQVDVSVDQSYEELAPLGVFTINDVSINDSAGGLTVEIAGADLSRKIARNKWAGTYVINAGTNYATAIRRLIEDRLPEAQFNFISTTRTTPRLVLGQQSQDDPWADARNLAADIGCELYFDARGLCTLREEPDPASDPAVWEFEDISFPTVTALTRQVVDENTYNQVIAQGEGSGNTTPVRAIAQDLDPASPTYIKGPYGVNSITITSPAITTVEQAQDAANAQLLKSKGATERVSITAVPNPALEPGDVVTVSRGLSKIDGQFLIDAVSMPLAPSGTMSITSRRQRL